MILMCRWLREHAVSRVRPVPRLANQDLHTTSKVSYEQFYPPYRHAERCYEMGNRLLCYKYYKQLNLPRGWRSPDRVGFLSPERPHRPRI
jgi:hypothetical protein